MAVSERRTALNALNCENKTLLKRTIEADQPAIAEMLHQRGASETI